MDRARSSPFLASMAVLSGGSAFSAAIGLVATPFLSRLYTPTEYGVLGVFAAAMSLFSVIATLRYDRAIPAAADEREAAKILRVALATVVVTSALCCVMVMSGALGLLMAAARGHELLLAWSLPLGMAAAGTYEALSHWMVRRRDYSTLSLTKVAQGSSMVGSQMALGLMKVGAVGLVVGQIAGSSMGIARLVRRIRQYDHAAFAGITLSELRATARTYRRFPLLSAPAVLLDALTGALPILVIATRFGGNAAGVFTIVSRVLLAPLALITMSLGQIYFGELATLHRTRPDAMLALFYRRLGHVVGMGVILVAAMMITVPFLLPIVLGARWGDATQYFLILSPMVFAGFISVPFSFSVDVLRRQDLHFLRDFLRAVVLTASLWMAGSYQLGALSTLRVISAAGFVNGMIYLAISWYALAAERQEPARA